MLNLVLKRSYKCDSYTIGHLYKVLSNGSLQYICDTVEDKDRGLNSNMTVAQILNKKVKSETAIPTGTYTVTLNVKSPKFSNFTKYPWAKEFSGYLPRLINVKGYEGVLIHVGSSAASSAGCLIVGENKVKGKVINSVATFNKLMKNYLLPAKKKGETIKLTIK